MGSVLSVTMFYQFDEWAQKKSAFLSSLDKELIFILALQNNVL